MQLQQGRGVRAAGSSCRRQEIPGSDWRSVQIFEMREICEVRWAPSKTCKQRPRTKVKNLLPKGRTFSLGRLCSTRPFSGGAIFTSIRSDKIWLSEIDQFERSRGWLHFGSEACIIGGRYWTSERKLWALNLFQVSTRHQRWKFRRSPTLMRPFNSFKQMASS